MNAEQKAALERLIAVAMQHHGGSRIAANFLLAWWNAGEQGGFDLTDLWSLDPDNTHDVLTVIGFIASRQTYPDNLGYGEQFAELIRRWRKPKRRKARA